MSNAVSNGVPMSAGDSTMQQSSAAIPPDNNQQLQQLLALQHQLQGASNASGQSQGILDMASVLSKIQSLEREKMELNQQLVQKDAKLDKLTENKRVEMHQMLETTISKFLEDLQTKDEKTKTDLKAGLNRLAQKGDETGVWEVVACASAAHVERVNELEKLRTEVNAFREREKVLQGGMFGNESARISSDAGNKRKADDISTSSTDNGVPDIFEEFSRTIMAEGGIHSRYTE